MPACVTQSQDDVQGAGGAQLAELHDVNARALSSRRARGGKGSRARRLEKFNESVKAAARWSQITQAALRQHRAKLRDSAVHAETHLRSAREKIRRAVWQAWTRRSLTIMGPRFYDESFGVWQPMRGDTLAPLSRRDMWVMKHAARLAKHVYISEPYEPRSHRHVFDWLCMGDDLEYTRAAAAEKMAEMLRPKTNPEQPRPKSKSRRKRR